MTNVLYQHGTLGTLMAGLLEGTASINDLLEHRYCYAYRF